MTEILRADQLSFRYPQHSAGLEPVSLSLEAGEGLLVSGPTGGGKSTLARCLAGLIPHLYKGTFSGTVWVGDLRTDQTPLWRLSELAGLLFQNPAFQMLAHSVEEEILFGLENLGLPRAEMRGRLEETLAFFHLEDFRARSPHTLSGGEQQKLALASILARQPALLVLDEPLSMLDSTSALELIDLIRDRFSQGTAVVACEHRGEYFTGLPAMRGVYIGPPHTGAKSGLPALPPAPWQPSGCDLLAEGVTVELGGKMVLDNLSLRVRAGQVTALAGRNGTGKTTLLRAFASLQSCAGKMVALSDGLEEKPQPGLVFQNPDLQLFNASVRAEILYRIPNPDLSWYAWLIEALELTVYEHTPPLLLSEGEKRRVALATILMRRPRHGILLDEPALGQDARHKAILIRLLQELAAQGCLVLLSTHDLELAAQTDQMILLGSGGILAQGPSREVLDHAAAWQAAGLVRPQWMVLT